MPRVANAQLSDYELKRQEQIAKNQALLRNLALDAASAGIAPQAAKSKTSSGSQKGQKKKAAPKKVKEEVVPLRTSSRIRGIVADSEVAKRKAEEEHDAFKEAERAKRQRISGDLNLSDIHVAGREWDMGGNFLRDVRAANPYERTFTADDIKETTDKQLRSLREKISGLKLWEDFEPNEIKITPERIYSLGFHPTTDKPLVFAGDKLGSLGVCDCSPFAKVAVKKEEQDEDDEEEEDSPRPNLSTFKLHTRTISAFQFSPSDSNSLYSASYDSTIRRLDLAKGVAVEVYEPADKDTDDPLSGVEIARSDPHTVYFTTLGGRFGKHDTRAGADSNRGGTEVFELCEKKIGGFSLHPQHAHLVATASLDRTMKLWDLRKITGRADWRLPALLGEHESKLSVSHAAFNAAGHVATSSYDDTVKIYDFAGCGAWKVGTSLSDAQMKPATIVPHNNQTGRWVTILRPQWQLSPQDGVQRFCIGNMNRFVDVYTDKGQQLAQLGGDGLVTAVPAVTQFHPTVDWVAAGTASGKLCLWM